MIPVTYFPVPTQHQFAKNRELIRGKPYEHYFDGDLWLHDDVLPALRVPMDPADAIRPDPDGLNSLLDPGHHAVENGFCELADGTGYLASRVPFPGCTGEMLHWWYWWCAVEPARFTLWYPHSHIAAEPVDRSVLTRPGLTHEQRHLGTTHYVDQYSTSALNVPGSPLPTSTRRNSASTPAGSPRRASSRILARGAGCSGPPSRP